MSHGRAAPNPRGVGRSQVASASSGGHATPTVARFLLAGYPRPPIEDAVQIGEALRLAVLAQFGWDQDPETGRRAPRAPNVVSGRDEFDHPLRDTTHSHAFWISEDSDIDGKIDHLTVYTRGGLDDSVRSALERLTCLWIPGSRERPNLLGRVHHRNENRQAWRLEFEGFGTPATFARTSPALQCGTNWCSVTPFLASGHLKRGGYASEIRRLMRLRGGRLAEVAADVKVDEAPALRIGGALQRPRYFKRFRSRSRERQPDKVGAMLRLTFPREVEGPLALGYACHFGLGLFRVEDLPVERPAVTAGLTNGLRDST